MFKIVCPKCKEISYVDQNSPKCYCVHCGTELFNSDMNLEKSQSSNLTKSDEFFTVTFKYPRQFYIVYPVLHVTIGNHSVDLHVDDIVPIKVKKDRYLVVGKMSFRKTKYDLNVDKDIMLRLEFNRITGGISFVCNYPKYIGN